MATRTLSVDEDAYRLLVRARRHAKESFSQVIKRAEWNKGKPRCGDILTRTSGIMSKKALDALDAAQQADAPPSDPWTR